MPAEASVSIVIPVRDGERYLAEAIESALDQEGPRIEVIVVDDGSRDASAEVAARFAPDVQLLRSDPRGAGAARNLGVQAASGTHVVFLDADDRLTRCGVARRLEACTRSHDPDLVWGRARCFHSPDLPPAETARLACPPGPLRARLPGTLLASREAFERVGPFATDLLIGEFVDWGARAHETGLREAEVDDVVLLRRLHATNQGRRRMDARSDYARVIKAALERRRRKAAR
jgi:glycosyltransferase involved in cell wall biosynthesis